MVDGSLEQIVIGQSKVIRNLRAEIEALAAIRFQSALVAGETGVGKNLVPVALVGCSRRPAGPLEVLDCAATPPEHFEGELLGTVAGAYPGAVDRPGAVERAGSGILLIDEIGSVPPAHQGALLRLLESRDFKRLGDVARQPVHSSLVITTGQPLGSLMEAGQLRPDLYYRLLQDVVIYIPPMRERVEDIPLLAQTFLADLPGSRSLDRDALEVLATASWPGNVRQLRAVVRAAARLCPTSKIDRMPVIQALRRMDAATSQLPEPPAHTCPGSSFHRAALPARRKMLTQAIQAAGGNQTLAGLMLGMHERRDGAAVTLDLRARKRAHRKFRYWWHRLVEEHESRLATVGAGASGEGAGAPGNGQ